MTSSNAHGIQPLSEFLRSVRTAEFASYAALPQARVRDTAAFEEMRAHILSRYADVEVVHSFTDSADQVFDCVPEQQHPSSRAAPSVASPQPPDLPDAEGSQPAPPGARHVEPQLSPDQVDAFGNQRWCPAGTVPLRRITLDELARFETLQQSFRKGGLIRLEDMSAPGFAEPAGHRHAIGVQTVNSLGSHSVLNVWRPTAYFSLSQHWCMGGTGGSTQTAEAGWWCWQGAASGNPRLFSFWTADNYATKANHYDTLTPVPGAGYTVGMALPSWSQLGGTQVELELAWYFFQGNWWLYVGGTKAANAIGYFPASQYAGGQLTNFAQAVEFGGETSIENAPAGTKYGQMGSGKFASAGYRQAAYQRDIYFYTTARAAQFANLTPFQGAPSCYTVSISH
jgi:Neprosin